jgi:hypothetical protein
MSRIVSAVKIPKFSFCFGFNRLAVRSAIVASSIAALISGRSRGLTPGSTSAADRRSSELAERNHRELVLRLAEQRTALGADPEHAEMDALDLMILSIGSTSSTNRRCAVWNRSRTPAVRCRLRWRSSTGRVPHRNSKVDVFARHA